MKCLEAGTGIEPVYTDLQSNRFRKDNNALTPKKYQDKARTGGEHDTRQKPAPTKENPGTLGGAAGAKETFEGLLRDQICQIRNIRATHFWDRNANCIASIPSIRRALA